MADERLISPIDARVRVVAVALAPALALARLMVLPLDDLQGLVATGYFREARSRGMSFRTIARRFGKSLRTVTNLAKRAANDGALRAETQRLGVRRRAVAWLATEGPADRNAVAATVPDVDPKDVDEALEELVESAILRPLDDGRFEVIAAHMDTRAADLDARLGSLQHLLDGLTMAIHQRFFAAEMDAIAMARVLTFDVHPDTLARLADDGYASLRSAAIEADAEASGEGAIQATLTFTITEHPRGPGWGTRS